MCRVLAYVQGARECGCLTVCMFVFEWGCVCVYVPYVMWGGTWEIEGSMWGIEGIEGTGCEAV